MGIPRILVVKEGRIQASQIEEILVKAGYEVVWAETGVAAMRVVRESPPDLVILDVVLPDLDGHDVCRLIKFTEKTKMIPVILLTAKGAPEDGAEGLYEGADDYLATPFTETELATRVYASLRAHKLVMELAEKNKALEEIRAQLASSGKTDPLTGLWNRRYFYEMFQGEFRRVLRYQTPLTCMLLDLDGFKKVNDTYGHQMGDEVLTWFAQYVRQSLRQVDQAARYGGDEFVLLFPQCTPEEALFPARRILDAAAHYAPPGLRGTHISVSIGISAVPDLFIPTPERLLQLTDRALYHAKGLGGNHLAICDGSGMHQGEGAD